MQRAKKLPAMMRLQAAGLKYGGRYSVRPDNANDADRRTVGRALDYKPVKVRGPYRKNPAMKGPRVEVTDGPGRSLYVRRNAISRTR